MSDSFTFAVIGHNEADRLHYAVGQAHEAAQPGDRVWFVDSASTDASAARAEACGAEVVTAPLGKGAAVAHALERCSTSYVCFVDGDMEASDCNIFAALRDTVVETAADMVVGVFTEARRVLSITPGLYYPLVAALFPEIDRSVVAQPLSGQRALRADLDVGCLPSGYGVETHLNLHVTLAGGHIVNRRIGEFVGPIRGYGNVVVVSDDVVAAIFDLAEARGRLRPAERPLWDAWVVPVTEVIASYPKSGEGEAEFLERVHAAAARPFPDRLSRTVPGR